MDNVPDLQSVSNSSKSDMENEGLNSWTDMDGSVLTEWDLDEECNAPTGYYNDKIWGEVPILSPLEAVDYLHRLILPVTQQEGLPFYLIGDLYATYVEHCLCLSALFCCNKVDINYGEKGSRPQVYQTLSDLHVIFH